MINVLFFSVLKDLTGCDHQAFSIEENSSSVSAVLDRVYEAYPAIKEWDNRLLIAVNGEYARRDDRLRPGDELALMPPVQGG